MLSNENKDIHCKTKAVVNKQCLPSWPKPMPQWPRPQWPRPQKPSQTGEWQSLKLQCVKVVLQSPRREGWHSQWEDEVVCTTRHKFRLLSYNHVRSPIKQVVGFRKFYKKIGPYSRNNSLVIQPLGLGRTTVLWSGDWPLITETNSQTTRGNNNSNVEQLFATFLQLNNLKYATVSVCLLAIRY